MTLDAPKRRGQKPLDITGNRYGRLVALRMENHSGARRWLCRCDCGEEKVILGSSLRSGVTTSCGCYQREVATEFWRRVGSANHRGDDVSYRSAHLRLRRERGRAAEMDCVDCAGPAAEWSLPRDATPSMWGDVGDGKVVCRYSPDPAVYEPRCVRCHRRYDRRSEAS